MKTRGLGQVGRTADARFQGEPGGTAARELSVPALQFLPLSTISGLRFLPSPHNTKRGWLAGFPRASLSRCKLYRSTCQAQQIEPQSAA